MIALKQCTSYMYRLYNTSNMFKPSIIRLFSTDKDITKNIRSKRMKQALDQKKFALKLYKGILRAHQRLPLEMRKIGDEYVRNEFKLHKKAETQHLQGFFKQWLQYLQHMSTVEDFKQPGKNFDENQLDQLNEEQATQLQELYEEIQEFYNDGSEKEKNNP